MNKSLTSSLNKSNYVLIFLSGFLSIIMHPTMVFGTWLPDMGFLAGLHLVPLYYVLFKEKALSLKKGFGLCLMATVIGHYGHFFWLMDAMKNFGDLNTVTAFLVLTAHVFFFGGIAASFFWLAFVLKRKSGWPIWFVLPIVLTFKDFSQHYIPFNGYPYGIAPYSQGHWLFLFQWIDVTGPMGVSFFIYLVNACFVHAFLEKSEGHTWSRPVLKPLIAVVLIYGLSGLFSFLSLQHYKQTRVQKGSLNVALLQANVAQDIKWNPKLAKKIVGRHVQLMDVAVKAGAELVVWPETSYPFGLRLSEIKDLRFLNRESFEVPLMVGSHVYHDQSLNKELYNGALLVDADAHIKQIYRKMQLVPFGEYLPFKPLMDLMKGLTQGMGYFSAGTETVLFDIKGFKWGPLICIEDIFPRFAREAAKLGADVLVNFTNDAWYGKTAMQSQHIVYNQFRSLENRKPMIRSTNTGYTAVIDPSGKIIAALPEFEMKILLHDLKIEGGSSFYTQYGDTWLMGIFALVLLIIAQSVRVFLKQRS